MNVVHPVAHGYARGYARGMNSVTHGALERRHLKRVRECVCAGCERGSHETKSRELFDCDGVWNMLERSLVHWKIFARDLKTLPRKKGFMPRYPLWWFNKNFVVYDRLRTLTREVCGVLLLSANRAEKVPTHLFPADGRRGCSLATM